MAQHALIGKLVYITGQPGKTGMVTSVVNTRFGQLAVIDNDPKVAYAVHACIPVTATDQRYMSTKEKE